MGLSLLAVVLLLAANAFFVAAEFALVKVRALRIDALAAAGALPAEERAALHAAFAHLGFLLLRQQVRDRAAGRAVGYRVPRAALSRAERASLIDAMRAIERLRERVAVEIGGRTV